MKERNQGPGQGSSRCFVCCLPLPILFIVLVLAVVLLLISRP